MKMRWLAGVAGMVLAASISGAAMAQALGSTTVNLPDGTTIVTTINGPTTMTIAISGGPNPAATVNITNLSFSGDTINYTGTVTTLGSTTPFDCALNTTTQAVSGAAICNTAFGGGSGGGGGSGSGGASLIVTPPTTGGAVVTAGPNGTTTITLPNGYSVSVNGAQLGLIRNVEAEQFLLSLAAERMLVGNVQSVIASRLQQLQAAGLAPGNLTAGEGYTGRSAGVGGLATGVWVDGATARIKNDFIGSGVDGDSRSIAVGADLSNDGYTVGAFASYTRTDLDGIDAVNKTDGFTGALYGRVSIMPQLGLTAAAGMGDQDVFFGRTAGALVSRGDTDRSAKFALLSVDSQINLSDAVVFVPSLSVSYAETETDPYIDSNGFPIGGLVSDTTIGNAGGTVFFSSGAITPYVTAIASRQLNSVAGVDRSYATFGGGVIAPIGAGMNLLAGVQTLVGKDGENETGINLTLRKGF